MVDFANTPSLADAEVVLYDLDPDSLPPALKVAEHVAERRGIALSARATTDIDDALSGAEYVIATFSVGGFASMRHDIEIPSRYGIRQTVGDSVGPGGSPEHCAACRSSSRWPKAMERCCPDALLVNVSNPSPPLCRAVTPGDLDQHDRAVRRDRGASSSCSVSCSTPTSRRSTPWWRA